MSEPLPALADGDGRERIVFLHGFGGSARTWDAVVVALEGVPSVAFDLPGHGAAAARDDLSTVEARNAVLCELDRLGVERAHLVGHSRGGAIATLVAIKVPERIASLTLLAPGGFGEEIAADALEAFARAETEAELREAMTALYRPARPSRRAVAQALIERQDPALREALVRIRQEMTPDGRQGRLRLDALANAPFPIAVWWGEEDAVLPVAQAEALPDASVCILPDAGHMLPAQASRRIAAALATQFRTNRALTER